MAARPRRLDVTMSRRTRRPALAAGCHQDQGMEMMEGSQLQLDAELKAMSGHKVSQPFEEQITLQQQLDKDDDEKAHHQQQQGEDNLRRLSLKELIDEAINGDARDTATGSQGKNTAAAAAAAAAHEADAASATKQLEHVGGRGMIGIVRRYVRVRSIKAKRSPEKSVAPALC